MNQQAIDILKKFIVSEQLERQSILSVQHKQYFLDPTLMLLDRLNKVVNTLWDGWIPVTERLPEESWRYLVFWNILPSDNERCSWFSNFDTLTWLFVFNFFWQKTTPKITHWQPLPLPPNK